MNKRQVLLLTLAVIVVGAIGLALHLGRSRTWISTGGAIGRPLLQNFQYNDVGKIVITAGTNTVHLARQDGQWRVLERAGYPANFKEISSLLLKLAELKAVRFEEVGPSQRWRFGLLPPGPGSNTATEVVFQTETGSTLAILWLGKHHMRKPASTVASDYDASWPDGRYVLTDTNATKVALVSETFAQMEPKPDQWLDREFFKVNKPRRISVKFPEPTNSWTLSRTSESADWQLENAAPGEKLDSSKASGYNYVLNWPSFNDVLPGTTDTVALGLTNPTVITIETFEDFTYTLKLGTKTNDAYPLIVTVSAALQTERKPGPDEKPEDKEKLDKEFKENLKKLQDKLRHEQSLSNWVYLVPVWTVDTLLRERNQLLTKDEKSEEKPEAAPASEASPEPGSSGESEPAQAGTATDAHTTQGPTNAPIVTGQVQVPLNQGKVITSDIIKVPSAEELKKGAKIEVIKASELEKLGSQTAVTNPAVTQTGH